MDKLMIAIKARWDSASGATARGLCPGDIFQGRAPAKVSTPYVIVMLPSSFSTDSMGSELIRPLVEWTVFDTATSPQAAWAANEAIRDLYADVLITVTGWSTIQAQVENPGIAAWDDDSKAWGITMDIRYILGK